MDDNDMDAEFDRCEEQLIRLDALRLAMGLPKPDRTAQDVVRDAGTFFEFLMPPSASQASVTTN